MQKILLTFSFIIFAELHVAAIGFGEVHGDDGTYSKSSYFEQLGDNDISAGTIGGWKFKTASVSGPPGKTVKINENSDGLNTSNAGEEDRFNYVSFTITVDGALTKPSEEDGSSPNYSLDASRNQPKYFPVFGLATSTESNPGFLSTIKAYIPIMTNSLTVSALEAILAGRNDDARFISGRKISDWSIYSPSIYYDIKTGDKKSTDEVKISDKATFDPFPSTHTPPAGQYTVKGKVSPRSDKQELTALVNVVEASFTTMKGVLCIDNFTDSSLSFPFRDETNLSKGFSCPIYYAIDNKTNNAYASVSSGISEDCFELKVDGKIVANEIITVPSDKETTLSVDLISPKELKDGELVIPGNIGIATWCTLPLKKIGVMNVSVNGAGYAPLNPSPLKAANIEIEITKMEYTYLPGKTIWHVNDLYDLGSTFKATAEYLEKFASGYRYIQFTVPGSFTGKIGDFDYSNAVGVAMPGGFSVILQSAGSMAGIHELGHLLGEPDFIESKNPIERGDSANLMHYANGTKLRYHQWQRMNDLALTMR